MSISLFRSVAGQFGSLRAVNTVPMMNTISHLIENQVTEHRMPVDFFAGFQKFSNFPDQMRRYARLAAACRRVYIVGVPDVRPPSIPGVEFIAVDPIAPLAREWFVVVNAPQFWTALVTQEVEGRDSLTGGRRYDGLWSYDYRVVDRASLLLSQLLGDFFQPVEQRDYAMQAQHIAAIGGKLIEKHEYSRGISRRRWAQMCTVHTFAEALVRTATPQLLVHNLPAALLHESVQILRSMFGATAVAVVLNDEGDEYGLASVDGEGVVRRRSIQAGEGLTGQAITRAEPLFVSDNVRGRDPLMPAAPNLIAVPLVGRRRVYGAITVAGSANESWNEEDRRTLQVLANMMAVIIEQRVQQRLDAQDVAVRAQRLERALVAMRRPIGEVLALQQQLRGEGGLTPDQLELVEQIDSTMNVLAQALGVRHQPLQQRAMGES